MACAPSRWIDPTLVGAGVAISSGVVFRIIFIWVSISLSAPFYVTIIPATTAIVVVFAHLDRNCHRDCRDRGGGPHHPGRGSLVVAAVMIVLFFVAVIASKTLAKIQHNGHSSIKPVDS
jgi:hypothetical protein